MTRGHGGTPSRETRSWFASIFSRPEPEQNIGARVPSGINLDDHLPQAREERQMTQAVSKLKLFLDSHVEDFYVSKTYRLRSGGDKAVEPLSDSDEELEGPLNAEVARMPPTDHRLPLSSDPSSARGEINVAGLNALFPGQQLQGHQPVLVRRSVIFREIAEVLISCVDPYGDETKTFLPREVVLFFHSLQNRDRPEHVYYAAISQWKRVTSYLLNFHRSAKHYPPRYLHEKGINIDRAIAWINRQFGTFSREDEPGQKDEHLREIMNLTADLGILMLSQPAIYDFKWDQSQNLSRIKFPGLWKMTDNNGVPLPKPEAIALPDFRKKRQRPSRRATSDLEYRRQSMAPRNYAPG